MAASRFSTRRGRRASTSRIRGRSTRSRSTTRPATLRAGSSWPARSRRCSSSSRATGLPERLLATGVCGAREDEEQVGEPVQIDSGKRVDTNLLGGVQNGELGAPADRASDVQAGSRIAATGDDEALQLGQVCVEAAAESLELIDRALLYA